MAIIGPGAIQDQEITPGALLENANEYEYVSVLNPFTDDFAVRVAQDVPVNMPIEIRNKTAMHQNQSDVERTLGFPLKGPDFQSRKHIFNNTIIPAGSTVNLKGNEAQIAVRQIVNEMLQREGNQRFLADPVKRREAEEKVVMRRGSIQELMDGGIQSQRSQIDQAINKSNEVANDQAAFPDIAGNASQASGSGGNEVSQFEADSESTKRSVGRPKKAGTVGN